MNEWGKTCLGGILLERESRKIERGERCGKVLDLSIAWCCTKRSMIAVYIKSIVKT